MRFLLFADDTSIFCSDKDPKQLKKIVNQELSNISNWLKANKLSLNESKTKVLVYRYKAKKNDNFQVKINDTEIGESRFATYLGIIMDNKLNFTYHVDHDKVKMKKSLALLAKLRHFVPTKQLKMIYAAHIESHINYGLTAWSSAPERFLKKIKNNQLKALCLMNFKDFSDANDNLFKETKFLPLSKIKKLCICKLFWKISHKQAPDSVISLLEHNGAIPSIRESEKFILPFKSTFVSKRFFTYEGIKLWNRLPLQTKEIGNFSAFKTKLKSQLLEN